MHSQSNRSVAERVADALIEAAEAKNRAAIMRKIADRRLDALFLSKEGAIDIRKAQARADQDYIRAEDAAMEAEHQANIAKARLDAVQIEWETWRTLEANKRAEMRL